MFIFRFETISFVLITYSLLTCIIYFVSDFAIFPIPKSSYQDSRMPHFLKLITQDNKKISALYLPNQNAHFTLLVSHGNGEDLGSILHWLMALHQHGFSVFAYDYHGYGTSEGSPSEKNTYKDIHAAYQYITSTLQIPSDKIILLGRSLGSGPTLDLASKNNCAGVIIESGLLTAFRVVTVIPLFPVDKYRNNQKIKNVHVPILIIHGTQDEVIPFWHGTQLFTLANSPKDSFWVKGASHNNIMEVADKQYFDTITEFAKALPKE